MKQPTGQGMAAVSPENVPLARVLLNVHDPQQRFAQMLALTFDLVPHALADPLPAASAGGAGAAHRSAARQLMLYSMIKGLSTCQEM
jgi:hypothetical protein